MLEKVSISVSRRLLELPENRRVIFFRQCKYRQLIDAFSHSEEIKRIPNTADNFGAKGVLKKLVIGLIKNILKRHKDIRMPIKVEGKGNYQKISYSDRKKLIKMVSEDKAAIVEAAKEIGIKPSTARMIILKFRKEGTIF